MKNTFKKLAVLASMVIMMAVTTISAHAAESRNDGTWKQNETGWWYEFVDGSYLKNGWYWIDGNHDEVYECYYFDGNGYMAANTTIGSDMVDASGAWVVNGVVQTQTIECNKDIELPAEAENQQQADSNSFKSQADIDRANDRTWQQAKDIIAQLDPSTYIVLPSSGGDYEYWH